MTFGPSILFSYHANHMKSQRENGSSRKESEAAAAPSWKTRALGPPGICLALSLVTVAVFWPVTTDEFVNLDDQVYVTTNLHAQAGMTWASVVWAFTNLSAGFWHPLTWLSIMLDCQMFGLHAGGHHLTSLLLHATNTVLLFAVLRQMTRAIWRSAFVAALFALHPLHVETVAWAADRKDVLSTLFWLLTMLMYLRYVEAVKDGKAKSLVPGQFSSGWKWFAAALFFFSCAIMSKTMVVTLPLILLLLDWWPLGRFQRLTGKRLLLEKLPFFAISFFAGLLTVHAEKGVGALSNTTMIPARDRLANAFLSCCQYLAQSFWPTNLAVFYPYPDGFSVVSVAGAALFLVIVSVLILRSARETPYLLVGWLWFLVTLLPVIGLIQIGSHARADRYTYVPLVGVFIMAAWGAHDLAESWRARAMVLSVAGGLIIILCTMVTRRQISYWQNSETLFRHVLRATQNNCIAYYCLGVYLSDHGQIVEAMKDYEVALEIDPAYGDAHNNLGIEIAKQGNLDAAIGHFRKAISSDPRLSSAHANLGLALALQGKRDEAIAEFQESLRLQPDDAPMHLNLGDVMADQGRFKEAIGQFREASRLDLNSPQIHFHLGMALERDGQREEAKIQFAEALRLKPDYADAERQLRQLDAPASLPSP
jgi:Flp pilus assembly protein TadD